MAASDSTSLAFLYKTVYSGSAPRNLAERDHPFYRMVQKDTDFVGNNFVFGIIGGNPQGISNVFATAQTNAASSKGKQFTLTITRKYGVITLDALSIAQASQSKGAFLTLVTTETDGVLTEMGDHIAFDLYRGLGGARGQNTAGFTATVITLTTRDDARNFKVGMTISCGPNANGSSLRAGTTDVTAVDIDAGTITVTSTVTLGTGALGNSDYLFNAGTEGTNSSGLADWIPLAAPGATSFYGVDRTSNVAAYSGLRVDDTGTSIEENIQEVATRIASFAAKGPKPSDVFLNPLKWSEVSRRLDAKVEYDDDGDKLVGSEYITIATPSGRLKCRPDPDCPTNRGYVVAMDSWHLKSLKESPHIVMDDTLKSLRQATADGVEIRVRSWHNLYCDSPGCNGVFSI